jgi:hypothetical protein
MLAYNMLHGVISHKIELFEFSLPPMDSADLFARPGNAVEAACIGNGSQYIHTYIHLSVQ